MEPRPPKRPKPIPPSAVPYSTYQGLDSSANTGSSQGAYSQAESTGVYRPPVQYEDPATGIEFPVTPRSQRGRKWLGPLLGLLLLGLVIGGIAWAATRYLDGDEKRDDTALVANTPTATVPAPTATLEVAITPTIAETATLETQPTEAPTEAAQADATEPPADSGEPTEASSGSKTAEDYIVDASEVGEGFAAGEGGERTADEVAAAIGDDGAAKLEEWDWRENFYQEYAVQSDSPDANATTFMSISAHRFGNSTGASDALIYLSDLVMQGQGLTEVEMAQIGDQSIALSGQGTNADGSQSGNIAVIYVRDGKNVIRIGGFSAAGDPMPDVQALAEQLVS